MTPGNNSRAPALRRGAYSPAAARCTERRVPDWRGHDSVAGQAPTKIVGDAVIQAPDSRGAAATDGRERMSKATTHDRWSRRLAVGESGGQTRSLGFSRALLGELEGKQGIVVVHGGFGLPSQRSGQSSDSRGPRL